MARRAAEPEYEVYDDEAEDRGGEDAEYVACPVCNGRGRGCRYCDGYGDVHPEDLDAILEAHKKERGFPVGILIVALCLVVGAGAAVFMVFQSQKHGENAVEPAAETKKEETAETEPTRPKFEGNRTQEMMDVIVSMRISMKAKDYQAVITEGEANLPNAKDPNQRRSIELMIQQAKKKLGQGG